MNRDKKTREIELLRVEDVQRSTDPAAAQLQVNIHKLRHPIEIKTVDTTYCLSPTEEEFQWKVNAGKYEGEIVAVLGSWHQRQERSFLIQNQVVVGYSLVLMRENGSKIITSPIQSFQVINPTTNVEKYGPGMILADCYQLTEMIGRGAAGVVYCARHLRLNRYVAVKILQLGKDQPFHTALQMMARFQREIDLLTRINHPYIANIIDQGTTAQNDPFMVMDLIEGETLKRYIKNNHPLNFRQIQRLFRQLGLAVFALHELGILHRDLKPENVIVQQLPGREEIIRLLDFGIAKLTRGDSDESVQALTQTGILIGTLDYMSPEQCQGLSVTASADIYSLGIVLYEMITGSVPFTATTPMTLLLKHVSESPLPPQRKRPDVPLVLSQAVLQALEKEPQARYQNALDFVNAVDFALRDLSSCLPLSMPAAIPSSTSSNTETINDLPAISIVDNQQNDL
ncbi:MAG: serine/threonine-protein kinase [Acidobacteriota bacterium]